MLGTEPALIENYVESGQLKLAMMPVINHGNPSVYSHTAAECAAQQNMDLFWELFNNFYEDQSALWRADADYFIKAAVAVGTDQEAFENCYFSGQGTEKVMALDAIRRERGIFGQPVFDIGDQLYFGALPLAQFSALIETEFKKE